MSTSVKIVPSWYNRLASEFKQPYFLKLVDFVKKSYQQKRIYPPGKKIFNAFDLCSFEDLKVVILGQDPYHGPGQAHGLCFSVPEGVPMPPSLINIFKEIQRDLNQPIPANGNLERWAQQGVLLLNVTLTVESKKPGSHQQQGWEQFTDQVIATIAHQKKEVVFMLWGSYAQKKGAFINQHNHLILTSPHPSPFSAHRGFLGNSHFSLANNYLIAQGKQPINW